MFSKHKKDVIETINDIINRAYETKNFDVIRILTMVRNREGIIGKLVFSFMVIMGMVLWYYMEIKYWLKDIPYYTRRWLRKVKR